MTPDDIAALRALAAAATPGPWRAVDDGNVVCRLVNVVCRMAFDDGSVDEEWPVASSCDDNDAAYIAAAHPAAIIALLDQMAGDAKHAEDVFGEALRETIEELDAALARAERAERERGGVIHALGLTEDQRDAALARAERAEKALREMIPRFRRCIIASGSDAEHADAAVAAARAALAQTENNNAA